jgi:phosphoribosylformimino-5-aminoimidazole carboxamide ribotide isomerase
MIDLSSSKPFTLYPAIDLHTGNVVRLLQGDPAQQMVYSDDPAAIARRWQSEGAAWLHVVNLDGAFGEKSEANAAALQAILEVGLAVQFGGGLRDIISLQMALDAGVMRAVIGTAAVENPALVEWALRIYGPERIAVGIDARDGLVCVKGWTQTASLTALDLGTRLAAQGVQWCIFTDVSRDGMRAGVNVPAALELASQTGLRVIASGGVDGPKDVYRARQAGLAGIIVGRALYEGKVSLRDWMAA